MELSRTRTNIWMVASAAAQVVDGNLKIHVNDDATANSYLQLTDFRLWKILDKSDLYDQIAAGKSLAKDDYTPDTWQAYQTALTAANTALANAATQQALNSAANALKAKQAELNPIYAFYTVSLEKPEGAELTVTPASAKEGDTVTVQVGSLPAGQTLDTLTAKKAGGGEVTLQAGDNGSYTFEMPAENVTVTLTLKAQTFTVTAAAGEHGAVTPASQNVEYDQNAAFTVTPEPSYHVDAVTVTPETAYEMKDGVLTVKKVKAATTVSVTFAADPVAVPTVKSVAALADVTVDYGTAYAALELPAKVEATLSDDTKADASISWAKGDYDGNTAGTYTLTGTLAVAGAENPDNLTASIKVTVQPKPVLTIESVAAIDDQTVDYGTAYADLKLPAKAEVTLSDNTKADASVSWAKGEYDGDKAGTYTLTGTLAVTGADNPDNLTAAIKVIVQPKPVLTIKSVAAIADVEANYGTSFSDLKLPAKAEVTLSDDSKANATVTWDKGDYNGKKLGVYTLTGTLLLVGAENPDNLTAIVKVTVVSAIEDFLATGEAGEHGSISPESSLVWDTGVTYTITPDEGYEVDQIIVTPADVAYTCVDGKLIIDYLSSNVHVAVTFKAIAKPADKTALTKSLAEADALVKQAEAGEKPGQYPESAITAFRAAVASAQAILDKTDATDEEVAQAVSQLAEAQRTFEAAKITDNSDSESDKTTTDSTTTTDSSSDGNNTGTSGGSTTTQGGSGKTNNPKTSSAIPAASIALLALSGGALWLTAGKRRRSK